MTDIKPFVLNRRETDNGLWFVFLAVVIAFLCASAVTVGLLMGWLL